MPTQKGGYYLKDGTRVPSVTTIISNCKIGGIDGLLSWAHKQGAEGKDFRETRQAAADAGTCAHEYVDAEIHFREFEYQKYPESVWKAAQGPIGAYLQWKEQNKMELVAGEMALVSEEYKYGGTLDAIAINDKIILADWKTSNGVYPEYLIQVRAYGHLWNEANPDCQVEGYMIARFSKQETPDQPINFTVHYWDHLDQAWRAFLLMREMYELNKTLRKMS